MASKATTEQAAAKFPLESLRKNCRAVFGVSSCVFAGATADLPDGEYTKEDIKPASTHGPQRRSNNGWW